MMHEITTVLRRPPMQVLQGGLATDPLAVRTQHDYLTLGRKFRLPNEQFKKRTFVMNGTQTTRPTFGTTPARSFLSPLLSSISAWNDTRVTRNALGKLSDRELDDIGLSRGDIDAIGSVR